jgi:hypothetical protein
MTELDDFAGHARLADQLIDRATKDQRADVARLLALNIGYYQHKYGDVPQDVLLRMVKAEAITPETADQMVAGMQNLFSALAEMIALADDLPGESRH